MRTFIAALASVALLVSGLASAQAPAPTEFDRYYDSALAAFEGRDYQRARELLGKARKLAQTREQDARCSLTEGVVLVELGLEDDARAAFASALALDPDASVGLPLLPRTVRLLESAREEARRNSAARVWSPNEEAAPRETASDAQVKAKVESPPPVVEKPVVESTPRPAEVATSKAPSSRRLPLITTVAGVTVLAGGVGCLLIANGQAERIRLGDESIHTTRELDQRIEGARNLQVAGVAMTAVGAAAAVAGAGWYFLSDDGDVNAAVVASPAGVLLAGTF